MNDKTVVFISGRISGDPGYKAKFNEAQYRLENVGFKVLNPAWMPQGLSNAEYMRMCFSMIDVADVVVLLPDWHTSPGANLEREYCKYIKKPMCGYQPETDAQVIKELIRIETSWGRYQN